MGEADGGVSIYFPMAAPDGPVGYARVLVGGDDEVPRLPLENFDVRTVGDAWGSLHEGRLWPATPPAGTLRWRPSFLGTRKEIDAARSRGKSAHLAILIAVAAWQAGQSAASDPGPLALWATGELDRDGRLLPVDGFGDKLCLALEFVAVNGGSALFLAPAANRTTVDTEALRASSIRDLRFDASRPIPVPKEGQLSIVWVNRHDVGLLLQRLVSGLLFHQTRTVRAPSRRSRVATLAALPLVAALVVAGWSLMRASREGTSGAVASAAHEVPAPLEDARFVVHLRHDWGVDLERVFEKTAGAERDHGYVVWEESLGDYELPSSGGCGYGRALPRSVTLRYALSESEFAVGAVGDLSDSLSVLRPPYRFGLRELLPSGEPVFGYQYRRRTFGPRWTVLGRALVRNAERLMEAEWAPERPATREQILASDIALFSGLDRDVHLLEFSLSCCGPDNACDASSFGNWACPLPSPTASGLLSRSLGLTYENPKHSWIALYVMSDARNRTWVELDGRERISCAGPHGLWLSRTEEFPAQVTVAAERSWSHVQVEVSLAVLADAIQFRDLGQAPAHGLSEGVAPNLVRLAPGWSSGFEALLWTDFSTGTMAPFSALGGDASVRNGRLRLLREGGAKGDARATLSAPARGAWTFEISLALATDDSSVAACLQDRSWSTQTCLVLNTKTENDAQPGAHLLCEYYSDTIDVPPEAERIEYRFDPGVGVTHRLRLEHLPDSTWKLSVDGVPRGESKGGCLVKQFDAIELIGNQDSNPGHGGFFDDIVVLRPRAGERRGRVRRH